MHNYKIILHYPDGSHEELPQSPKDESEAIELAQASCFTYKLGYRPSPGGNLFDGKGDISYEIIEINP